MGSFLNEDEDDDCIDEDCNEIYDDNDEDYYDDDDYDTDDSHDDVISHDDTNDSSHNTKSQVLEQKSEITNPDLGPADPAVIPEPPFNIGAGHSSATATANIISQKTQNFIVVLCVFQAWAWLLL